MNWLLIFLGLLFLFIVLFAAWAALAARKVDLRVPGFDETGSFVVEEYPDPTLPAPTVKIFLGNFSRSEGLPNPNPWCTPTWYAIRYVRQADGGYSELGPWSELPVQAGAEAGDLPCPNGICGFDTDDTCLYNSPVIGNVDPLAFDITAPDPVWANIHRRTTPPADDGFEGTVVGVLLPTNNYRLKGFWQEAAPAGKLQTTDRCPFDLCGGGPPAPATPCSDIPGAPPVEGGAPEDEACAADDNWLRYADGRLADAGAPLDALPDADVVTCELACRSDARCNSYGLVDGVCTLHPDVPDRVLTGFSGSTAAVSRAALAP
uniref:Membrane protein n=1 Tax=Marseillevirus LCMAC103 TaxID=2506604 RepID=A0A481YVM4_9VIRU|nr:MAG: membrane protein [Marseillevirus LCMAC103]